MEKQNSMNRRRFLKASSLTAISLSIGLPIVYGHLAPLEWKPLGINANLNDLPGKSGQMIILNDRPVNAETPPHLLDDKLTPNNLFFVRNNGLPPSKDAIDAQKWILRIDGESVSQKKQYTLKELKSKFKTYTYHLTLECGGNGRKEFNPPAKGNQWNLGAVGCAAWTGVRLRDVLMDAGIENSAKYIGYYGKDLHLSGDPKKSPISRGVPIKKALEEHSLIAWAMNGEDLPWLNGYPLRLVFGGWPASCSGKWLSRISIRDKVHDGTKMKGQAYRVPCKPVAPGSKVEDKDMCIIESMPVKSLITFPKTGATIKTNQRLPIRGHAWAGENMVKAVHYSIDFGSTWQLCQLETPVNKYAWQHFSASINFPQNGYYEVWVRATDQNGISQPMLLPGWNPKGYLNNACHRIAVKVK